MPDEPSTSIIFSRLSTCIIFCCAEVLCVGTTSSVAGAVTFVAFNGACVVHDILYRLVVPTT